MNKETFKKNLKNALTILTEEAKEEELNRYVKKIEEQDENISEEERIKNLGTIEEIRKEIYARRGIDEKKAHKKKNFLYRSLEELFETIHNVVETMSKNHIKENLKILLDLLILIVIICAIKIPFIFIENIGDSLFEVLENPMVMNVWGFIIDLVYIIIAIMAFINIFNRWFKNLKKDKTEIPNPPNVEKEPTPSQIEGQELESISLEQKEEK